MKKVLYAFVLALVMTGVIAGINYAYAEPLFGWDSLAAGVIFFIAAVAMIDRYERELDEERAAANATKGGM